MRGLKTIWRLIKETVSGWADDNATRLAAALAFYTVLSIAPLLVLAVAVAGLVFGEDAARGHIAAELSKIMGETAGKGVQTVLVHADSPDEGALGSIIGGLVLLFGASGVFGELQAALNAIWGVAPKPGRGIWGILRARFFSFSMVMGVAFLLLASLVLSALLSALAGFFAEALPGGATLWQLLNLVISFGVIALLFALIFKIVPDIRIAWREVLPGAIVTSALFSAGKYLLGLYLGRASVASPYGAAGSVVVFVIWVYYAAQIVFLGAEFTRVYARFRGAEIVPDRDAVRIEKAEVVAPQESSQRDGASLSAPSANLPPARGGA